MFAVFRSGGKQYRVQANDVVKLEKLDTEAGKTVTFDDVLFTSDGNGKVEVAPKTTVKGTVLETKKDKKVIIFKKKRRENHRRTKGHRQTVSIVKIDSIGGAAPAKKAETKDAPKKEAAPKAEKKTEAKKAPVEKPAAKKAPAKKPAAKKTTAKKS